MAEYDLIIKALADRYMSHIATLVRGMEVQAERIEPADKEAVAVKRTSDVLVRVNEDGYEYIMLVEFQARPDRKMAHRLLEYTAMHHRRYEKPVYPVVINLTGRGQQDSQYTSLRFSKELILKVLEVIKLENLPLFDGIREEWESKGKVIGRVDSIMDALEENTGNRPVELAERLNAIKEDYLLKDLLRTAIKTTTMEQFVKKLDEIEQNIKKQ